MSDLKAGNPIHGQRYADAATLLIEGLNDLRGTVTEFLEHLTHEPIFADKVEQAWVTANDSNRLGVAPGQPLLHRVAVLRGRRTLDHFVRADASLVPDRLPEPVIDQLMNTDNPIGRVLVDHGIDVVRVDLVPGPVLSRAPTEFLYARQYRIDVDDRPTMHISEWFLPDLARFSVGTA